ncbi:hypothetical protein [Maritalea sp.]|uniref:hypothetical protein n=1 Tax=Maritalea sp. TaxID=2003361 RepID=UPI003EF7F96C
MSLAWAKTLETGATVLFGSAVERSKPSLGYQRYWGGTLRAGFETKITDTLRVGVNLSATLRQYDNDFSAVDYARRDEIYRFGLSLSDSRIKLLGAHQNCPAAIKSKIQTFRSISRRRPIAVLVGLTSFNKMIATRI